MSLRISQINFDAAAQKFADERGLDRVAPCVIAAMQVGAEIAVALLSKDINDISEDIRAEHTKALPPDHGQYNGQLTTPICETGK